MVGQLLEMVKTEENLPGNETKDKKTTPTQQSHKKNHKQQHPQKAPRPAGKTTREICKLGETGETKRPSQPLKSSLPPCSTPPCCSLLDVLQVNICSWVLRQVTNVWQTSTLELVRTLSSLPPLCAILHECIHF